MLFFFGLEELLRDYFPFPIDLLTNFAYVTQVEAENDLNLNLNLNLKLFVLTKTGRVTTCCCPAGFLYYNYLDRAEYLPHASGFFR